MDGDELWSEDIEMEGKRKDRKITGKISEMDFRSRQLDAGVYDKKNCREKS